jgi:ABC-type sugar transport system permease subunit
MTPTGGAARRRVAPPSISRVLGTVIALCIINGFGLAFAYALAGTDLLPAAIMLVVVTVFINICFLVDRLYPFRWLSPAVLLTMLVVVYPVAYTVYVAFTNYGQGHLLTKPQALEQITKPYFSPPDAPRLRWTAYRSDAGGFYLWLTDPAGAHSLAVPGEGLNPVDPNDPRFGPPGEGGLPQTIDGYKRLSRIETVRYLSQLQNLTIAAGDSVVRVVSLDRAEVGRKRYTYDAARDVLVDHQENVEYRPVEGTFTAPDGKTLSPGFAAVVGPRNFLRVVTDPRIQGPFFQVFLWTFAFAALSVILTFAAGLGLALVLNDPGLPGKGIFRTLTIIPYTIPAFISALIWVGLLNPLYGPINLALDRLIGVSPEWFSDGTLAKVAIMLVNTWLGYPYMMLLCLGALQSISSELYEAAQIDGASAIQQFRNITFPLLLIALAPLLIGSFAFNFNNFTLIELVTEGGPPTPGSTTPAGQTDILISYTYRLAFSSGRGTDYAFASAIAVFIFLIVAVITMLNFRLSRGLEEVS